MNASASPATTVCQSLGQRMAAADAAPRCRHIKTNGVRCGSPSLRSQPYCYFHDRLYNPPYEQEFPFLEDANAVQVAIMQVLDGLRRGKLDARTAGVMLYGLQTASANLKRVHDSLQPVPSRVITEDPVDEARALREAGE